MTTLPTHPMRLAALSNRKKTNFCLTPDANERAALAKALGLLTLRKLRFEGHLIPTAHRDWKLEALLGATVEQPCSITLVPVATRIEEHITRIFAETVELPAGAETGGEVEMPEDDSIEPLPETLDLYEVLLEALALALPAYPRADGAEYGTRSYSAPGIKPMSDDDAKPFAGLAALRNAMGRGDESEES